jgi:hypothetical protein
MMKADMLILAGKKVEATKAYMTVVNDNLFGAIVSSETNLIWESFLKVNPSDLTVDEYTKFLENTLKGVRATEANASFLGVVKSELEKMK